MSDTTLSHSGSGDNVARDKNIVFETYINFVNNTVPENLKHPINKILKNITNREFTQAREGISLIASIENKNSEVSELLDLLLIKCTIGESNKEAINTGSIQDIMSSSKNEMIKDLALSLIFRSEMMGSGLEVALKRFKACNVIGPYSRSVAFELFLDKEDILDVFSNNIYTITEEECIGLINGLFRVGCYDEAYEAAEHLNRSYSNTNSSIVLHFAKSMRMNEELLGTEYWYLKQSQKNRVMELIDETIKFHNENKDDSRLFNIIIPCLIYVKRSHPELESICLNNIEEVIKFDDGFADDLKIKHDRKDISIDHPLKLIEKSFRDDVYKGELISKITSQKLVGYNDMRILSRLLSVEEFEQWVKKGVKIDGNFTALGNILNEIFIAVTIKDKEKIKTLVENILKEHASELKDVNPDFVNMLAHSMQEMDLAYQACDLLFTCFYGLEDIWCSHFVEDALYSLYNSARYKDFLDLYLRVNKQENSLYLDNLAIYVQLFHNSPDEAFRLIQEYRHENNLDFMRLKLLVFLKLERDDLIELEVNGYDYSLFVPPSPITKDIISLLVKCNQFIAFEKIILNWFIDSPEKNYKYISDACFFLISEKNNEKFTPSYNVQGVDRAIRYRDGEKDLTKLISSGQDFTNPHILNPGSNLYSAFVDAKVDDEVSSGMKTLKIEEIVPPYVAVHRLCISIRDEFNDGSDLFQSFSLSSDPDEMVEQLKKIIKARQPEEDELQSVLNNSLAPLNFRMALLDKTSPVKTGMHLLTNKSINKEGFIDFGEENTEEMCTDLVTVLYLCLTSFSNYFIEKNLKLFILQEDIDALSKWLESIDTKQFMIMGGSEDGGVFINTADTVVKYFGGFISNAKNIFKILHPLKIVLDNFSQEVTTLSESFGPNFSKNIYALKNSGLPFFSIDTQSCFLNRTLVPLELVNTFSLLNKARLSVPFNARYDGLILHAHGSLPYPLMVEDFISLSTHFSDDHGIHLSGLIKKYTGRLNKSIRIANLMALLVVNYFNKTTGLWRYGQLFYSGHPYGPRIDNVFNSACRSVIYDNESGIAEHKLAIFFIILFGYSKTNVAFRELIRKLAFDFCTGNFLTVSKVEDFFFDYSAGKVSLS